MGNELIDVYDENMNIVGQIDRGAAHSKRGIWHKSIKFWIIRNVGDGYVVFQRASKNLLIYPNLLNVTVSGHYRSGESVKDALRELEEEVGLIATLSDLTPIGIRTYVEKFNLGEHGIAYDYEFQDMFLIESNKEINEYILDKTEVEGLYQIKLSDGLKLFSNEVTQIEIKGIEWNDDKNDFIETTNVVTIQDFRPCNDNYYFKIFKIAKQFLNNESYLSI